MKRWIILIISISAVLIILPGRIVFPGSASKTNSLQITITVPSAENGPVTPGHGFFIGGTIESEQPVPADAVLRVSVRNEAGEEVRFAECGKKRPGCDRPLQ